MSRFVTHIWVRLIASSLVMVKAMIDLIFFSIRMPKFSSEATISMTMIMMIMMTAMMIKDDDDDDDNDDDLMMMMMTTSTMTTTMTIKVMPLLSNQTTASYSTYCGRDKMTSISQTFQILLNDNVWILIKFSLNLVPEGLINLPFGSDNGLSPGRRQAIIWTNDG